MDPIEYRFGQFRLIPAARELWQARQLSHTSPLVFDCLVYLLEHRERMVGRDELVSAIWGRIDVADQQVRQLAQRARQAVGDDAKSQHIIRTVSGSGYRWVMAIETARSPIDHAPPADSVPAAPPEPEIVSRSAPANEVGERAAAAPGTTTEQGELAFHLDRSSHPSRRMTIAGCALALLVAAFLFTYLHKTEEVLAPEKSTTAPRAVVVLPLDVDGPSDAGWLRLGAMDLVAQRMRSTGMPVSPSDNVVAAVHAVGEPNTPERLAKLRETLDAATLVQGSAVKSTAGWTVELNATGVDGERSVARIERPDIADAARDATDLLLAGLGQSAPLDGGGKRDDLDRLLQRAGAALLANQLDTARSILAGGPESLQNDPRVRVVAAQIEQRAGRVAEAEGALRVLLASPALDVDPEIRADALTTLGYIEMNRNDCAAAERNFDTALTGLQGRRTGRYGKALSARATAEACLERFDEAVKDLSIAGPLLDAAGDRLGRANLNNHFGAFELYRGRPAQAVAYLESAHAVHQSFGAVNSTRQDLNLLCIAFAELLQWPQALEASDALWALREHVDDAGALYSMAGLRSRILVRTGKYREAEALLRSVETARPEGRDTPLALTFHEAKAELSWARGDATQAIAAIDEAWKILLPSQMRDDEDLYTSLLRQRAAFLLAQPMPDETSLAPRTDETHGVLSVPFLVAEAERADHLGRLREAEAYFRKAMARAETRDVPASMVLVADAYARWLLARGRLDDASATAGRVAPWAERDFDSALLQVAVFQATGETVALAEALRRTSPLAGERQLPAPAERPGQ